jgi:ubiquinone/menaquinone biosynthesis C-methylase UbiE
LKRVDYDDVAPDYDQRYARNRYEGTASALQEFIGTSLPATLEVGCGTGHWLASLAGQARPVVGIDFSWGMLQRAQSAAPFALLARATAEHLPIAAEAFDRIFCVNALHHFPDPAGFVSECRRVLRPGGTVLTVGLDPNTGLDQWWVYDYFPASLEADRRRYLPTARIRDLLNDAGFAGARTFVAQHMPAERTFDHAERQGLLDRRYTSQLMVIDDEEFELGMRRLREERPVLRADLRLYATVAQMPTN